VGAPDRLSEHARGFVVRFLQAVRFFPLPVGAYHVVDAVRTPPAVHNRPLSIEMSASGTDGLSPPASWLPQR
jgi:hypothetical protein